MVIKPIHPFPARMAPELAIAELLSLKKDSIVLDPMAGSGTVVRHASELGLTAIGFDLDPLAVLMTRAWTTPVETTRVSAIARDIISQAKNKRLAGVSLPWIDDDEETKKFVNYWFGRKQQNALRRLSLVLFERSKSTREKSIVAALDVVKIALSRIIITKEQGASLARDASHSRPHRVAMTSKYDVFSGLERSVAHVCRLLDSMPPKGNAHVVLGDARSIKLADGSVDAVITSPPYLNAIDYMRGHRLALVWFGFEFADLRSVRSNSIGAERSPDVKDTDLVKKIVQSMGPVDEMASRHQAMISRYAQDVRQMMCEVSRVLKPGGKAVFVVGNSCLKGIFVRNSAAVARAGKQAGLKVVKQVVRKLPERNRYLPMTEGNLSMRMRTETVLTFTK